MAQTVYIYCTYSTMKKMLNFSLFGMFRQIVSVYPNPQRLQSSIAFFLFFLKNSSSQKGLLPRSKRFMLDKKTQQNNAYSTHRFIITMIFFMFTVLCHTQNMICQKEDEVIYFLYKTVFSSCYMCNVVVGKKNKIKICAHFYLYINTIFFFCQSSKQISSNNRFMYRPFNACGDLKRHTIYQMPIK